MSVHACVCVCVCVCVCPCVRARVHVCTCVLPYTTHLVFRAQHDERFLHETYKKCWVHHPDIYYGWPVLTQLELEVVV